MTAGIPLPPPSLPLVLLATHEKVFILPPLIFACPLWSPVGPLLWFQTRGVKSHHSPDLIAALSPPSVCTSGFPSSFPLTSTKLARLVKSPHVNINYTYDPSSSYNLTCLALVPSCYFSLPRHSFPKSISGLTRMASTLGRFHSDVIAPSPLPPFLLSRPLSFPTFFSQSALLVPYRTFSGFPPLCFVKPFPPVYFPIEFDPLLVFIHPKVLLFSPFFLVFS